MTFNPKFDENETARLLAHGLPLHPPFGHARFQEAKLENLIVRSKTIVRKAHDGIGVFQAVSVYISSTRREVCEATTHKTFSTLNEALCWLGAFSGDPLYLSHQEVLPPALWRGCSATLPQEAR